MIAIFNYIGYGYHRYFLGKYSELPLYLQIGKFIIGLISNFGFWLGLSIIFTIILTDNLKNILLKTILVISFLLGAVDIFLLKEFDSFINNSTIQILFETNLQEGTEFLAIYLKPTFIVGVILSLIIIFIISKIKLKVKSLRVIFIILVFSFIQLIQINNLEDTSIYRLIIAGKNSVENIKVYRKIAKSLENNIILEKNNSKIKNVILVIGESTTRNHMSLYGYSKKTNPLLEKLEIEGNLYVFKDVISPHAHTIPVLQKLLTFHNYEDKKQWYENNNIIDIMKKAGYKTYWFSNQESFGVFGNVAAALGNRSDIVLFNRHRDSEEEVLESYDEEIVNKSVEKIQNEDKRFIIYHLLGTHTNYANRFPKEFEIFNKSNYELELEEEKIEEISNYDNAILYNDYVLEKIINLYKDEETIVFYLSDHGEEVYEFRDFRGHSEDNSSRYMVEIPFLIYMSDTLKERGVNLENRIINSLNKPYMIDDFIHTLLDIVEIETLEYENSRSLINEEFNEKRERIFSGKSYDYFWKNKN